MQCAFFLGEARRANCRMPLRVEKQASALLLVLVDLQHVALMSSSFWQMAAKPGGRAAASKAMQASARLRYGSGTWTGNCRRRPEKTLAMTSSWSKPRQGKELVYI